MNNQQLLEKYENDKVENIFLAIKNRMFPEDEKGYSGVFFKNECNTPCFAHIENKKVKNVYNLQYYVAFDMYHEPIMY